jgi:hypothetical protein
VKGKKSRAIWARKCTERFEVSGGNLKIDRSNQTDKRRLERFLVKKATGSLMLNESEKERETIKRNGQIRADQTKVTIVNAAKLP